MHQRRAQSGHLRQREPLARPREQRNHTETLLAQVLLNVVDACLAAIVFAAPFVFGGRHQLGATILAGLCCLMAVAWFYRQFCLGHGMWRSSYAYGVLAGMIALVTLQVVPLPAEWLSRISPPLAEILPLWNSASTSAGPLGQWQTVSLEPDATKLALAMLLSYALLFVTTVQRLQTIDDIFRLFRWLALAAIMMAVFGILQLAFSNGRFFWFYPMPYSDTFSQAKGSFTCRNHFAHLLTLGTAPLIAWIINKQQRLAPARAERHNSRHDFSNSLPGPSHSPSRAKLQILALISGLAIVLLAVLLSFSRGGIAALAGTVCLAAVLLAWSRRIDSRHLLAGLGLGILLVAALSLHGYDRLASRFDNMSPLSDESFFSGRIAVWKANWAAIQDGWLAGSGSGTHSAIYPAYLERSSLSEFTHAENGYLQIASENGWLGALLLGMVIVIVVSWCLRALTAPADSPERLAAIAVTCAALASLAHSLFDFVWYIPACMSFTILLAACAQRLSRLNSRSSNQVEPEINSGRFYALAATTCSILITAWVLGTLIGPARASLHWDRYLLASIQRQGLSEQQGSSTGHSSTQQAKLNQALTEEMIDELRAVIRLHPEFGRAHLRLAGQYLRKFEERQTNSDNPMTVDQIREAALASKFQSSRELREWLQRAFGNNAELLDRANFHARRASQLGPLQGEAYLFQASLCFLQGNQRSAVEPFVDQALRVRPRDGDVLYAAGLQKMILGRIEQAMGLWQSAFRESGDHQQRIVSVLATSIAAEDFLQYFSPDWRSLTALWSQYKQTGTAEDLNVIARYAEALLPQISHELPSTRLAYAHYLVAQMQLELQSPEAALVNLQLAYQHDPDDFSLRRSLAKVLIMTDRRTEAEPHLRWCLARRPHDEFLRHSLSQLNKHDLSKLRSNSSQRL